MIKDDKRSGAGHRGKASEKAVKQSSHYPFIAEHRGGLITKMDHQKLMRWARECSEHVLSLVDDDIDKRLVYALQVAKEWESGKVPTGIAMKASVGAHAAARKSTNPVSIAVARSVGHAVATAHMADHSMGAALYALKALKYAGKSIALERAWQNRKLGKLPPQIVSLIQTTMMTKSDQQAYLPDKIRNTYFFLIIRKPSLSCIKLSGQILIYSKWWFIPVKKQSCKTWIFILFGSLNLQGQ